MSVQKYGQPEERRYAPRERAPNQPHPDQVRECARVAKFYGADLGTFGEDVIRRVLVAAAAWEERQGDETPSRRYLDARVAEQLAEAGRKAREYVEEKSA
jgi:hypothetical protein